MLRRHPLDLPEIHLAGAQYRQFVHFQKSILPWDKELG